MVSKNLLQDFFYIEKTKPRKSRVWYYQHAGEEKQEIVNEGRWWYYNAPLVNGGGEVGCDALKEAKGDLQLYTGTKIWSELINN